MQCSKRTIFNDGSGVGLSIVDVNPYTYNLTDGVVAYKESTGEIYDTNIPTQEIIWVIGFDITLSGTTAVEILSNQVGAYRIEIRSNTIDYPNAVVDIAKTDPTSVSSSFTFTSAASISSLLTYLIISWGSNTGIHIEKSNAFCDGTYSVAIQGR